MRIPKNLEVWKLGVVDYLKALKLQERLAADRKHGLIPDTLLALQHTPTYTLGKRRTDYNLLIPQSDLENIGVKLYYTQRGGDITFHGPHQAVLYPIISLWDIGIGARNYVEKLELTMIELAALYGVRAYPGKSGERGVWVSDRKIGAIGVRISGGITSHGLAFNIDPDLTYFKHIVPCGISDKEVTSLRRETNLELPNEEVIEEQLVSCFLRLFGYSTVTWKDKSTLLVDDGEIRDMEKAVFTETNISTRIAFSVPLDITTREFKRKIETEHFGCFPKSGEIKVYRVGVNRRSCLYYLPDFMPLKYAFRETNRAWFVRVEIGPSDAPGCSARKGHVYSLDDSKLQSTFNNTYSPKAKRKRAKRKHCSLKSTSIGPSKENIKEGSLSLDYIANGVDERCCHMDEASPIISSCVNNSELSKEEKTIPTIETSSATSSEVISVGGIIERYFTSSIDVTSFSEVASVSGQYSSNAKCRVAQSQLRRCKKRKTDSHIANREAQVDSSKFIIRTPPRLLSTLSSVDASPSTLMDRTAVTNVGKCLVTASHLLGLHEKSPILSLCRSKSGELLNNSPQVRFSVFEISEDEDDEAD